MKKLILVSAAALGFVSTASANAVDTVNKSGFYLGASGGYTFVKDKLQFNSDYTTAPKGPFATHKNLNPHGGLGGVHLGYQHDLGRMVAGVELSAVFTSARKKFNLSVSNGNDNLTGNIRRKNVYGAALRFGYKVAPCWVAGIKLGYERNNQEIKYNIVDTTNVATAKGKTLANGKRKLKHNGFAPGIYVEKLLNRHWMVGAEYSYAMYKQKSIPFDSSGINATTGGGGGTYKITSKPRAHDMKIRLGYKF